MRIPLRVVPEPVATARRVITTTVAGDTVVAHGAVVGRTHICGACGAPLLVGVRRAALGNAVIRCGACAALNAADE